MIPGSDIPDLPDIPRFDRRFFDSDTIFSRIGDGEPGGKARGLIGIAGPVAAELARTPIAGLSVEVPRSIVVTTDVFDSFMTRNDLHSLDYTELSDDRIAHAFQNADLPTTVVGDLKALVDGVHRPLAVRSSSRLEDALHRPFAGVYATKMTPNNQPDVESRFQRLVEAIKVVYASTFFAGARSYLASTDEPPGSEKMAVVIQEVVGERHGDRFYPDVSGVGRSYNFYPFGGARPEEGMVELALGLGKTIVDGDVTWMYSPAHPAAPPPFGSVRDRLRRTQLSFWSVNMGHPRTHDPMAEDEHLIQGTLKDAEYDGTLGAIASTYVAESDRLVPGVGRKGARVLDFTPLLSQGGSSFNDAVRWLLAIGESTLGTEVEIEFALSFSGHHAARTGRLVLLQVRPMLVSRDQIEIAGEEMTAPAVVIATDRALGNGITDGIRDIVYVRPESFDALRTPEIASDLEVINRRLVDERRRYLLIGFGRWGSTDPSLGIPVEWGSISGARAIVEATLPGMNVELSQGSHFFHNITSFSVSYLMVHHGRRPGIDWPWLDAQPALTETALVRHVRLADPIIVKVDGRTGLGVVSRA